MDNKLNQKPSQEISSKGAEKIKFLQNESQNSRSCATNREKQIEQTDQKIDIRDWGRKNQEENLEGRKLASREFKI